MYDTLFVEVEQTMEDLRHVQRDEVFGELSEVLADAVERSVFAVPNRTLALALVYVCVYGSTATHSRMM